MNHLTSWRRGWRQRIIVYCLFAVAVAAGTTWWVGGQMVAPASCTIGAPPADFSAESISFESKTGNVVCGWYAEAVEPRGLLLLLHPIRGSRLSMLPRAKMLAQAGFSVMLIDLQAHGESRGDQITIGYLESRDVQAAVEYAKRRAGTTPVGIIGRSLGGASALLAGKLDVDAMVLESTYSTIHRAVDNRVRHRVGVFSTIITPMMLFQMQPRLGFGPDALRPIDRIAEVQCPVLFMGGGQDYHTTADETREMYEACQSERELYIFEHLSHQDFFLHEPTEYRSVLMRFLDRHFPAD